MSLVKFSSLLASGLHHSINKSFSLITTRCCETRVGYPWDTDIVISRTSPPKRTSCGVARSCHLCFTSLDLLGTRGISLGGPTPRGVTFYSLSAERAATRFIFNGNPVSCLSLWRDGTGRTELGDRARLTLLVLRRPDESLKVVSDLHERGYQTLRTPAPSYPCLSVPHHSVTLPQHTPPMSTSYPPPPERISDHGRGLSP